MVVFRQRNIIAVKSLGEDLQKARQLLNLSLLSVEKKIGVSRVYLEAMENNDWEVMPGEVYAKNWLKKYVSFLALNWNEIKVKFDQEMAKQKIWPETDKQKFGVARKRLIVLPKLIKSFLFILVVVIIMGYLGWQLWSLLSPPKLELLYPEDNYVTKSSMVKILGRVEEGAWLGLNDKEIAAGSGGWFEVDIDLNKGLNIIKVEAKKSYGRTRVEYRRIIVED
jgi:transcriptional regulator with XRE-family HTH domain